MNGEHSFIPYGRQSIDEADIAAVIEALRSDWLTQGPRVQEFEEAFACHAGSRYAVAVSSGTAALHLSCLAAGLGPGDEVITSPITFVATANCALYVGARPAFVDIDPETFNLDPERLAEYLRKRAPLTRFTARAVIPVHFAGLPCDMPRIYKIAKEYDLTVIEDACHALGSKYLDEKNKWVKVGSCAHSDMAVFSFHPVKHITTGEGGMITTNNRELAGRLRKLRNHGITRDPKEFTVHCSPSESRITVKGQRLTGNGERITVNGERPWYYEMQTLGYNYRITDIQCALGRSQLKKIESFVERRRFIASQYSRMVTDLPKFRHQKELDSYQSSYHLYTLCTDDEARMSRDEIMAELKRMGVGTQVHYIPVYRHPFYRELKLGCDGWPNAENFFRHCLSIPMFPGMSAEDIEHVSNALKKVGAKL